MTGSARQQSVFADAVRQHRAGRLHEAERLCREILAIDPSHADGLHLLGVVAQQSSRADLALDLIARAIAINGRVAAYHSNLGNLLGQLGRLDEAVGCFRRALELNPDLPEAHSNLGHALARAGRLEEAADCCRAALDLRPEFPQALHNLGNLLWQMGRPDEAVACCARAAALRPDDAEARTALGIALRQQGNLDDAVACSRAAIALAPDLPDAHLNLAMALLARGDFSEGWEEYEWRWRMPDLRVGWRGFAQPQWRGEPAAGRTLLLHAEQGFGDTLQFCRYALPAAARGMRVILEVQPALVRLLRGMPRVDQVLGRGEALPGFDLHCPLLSMPLAMRTTLATIPSATAYLRADPAQSDVWRTRLASIPNQGLRVGLAWAGNPRPLAPGGAALDRHRSIAAERLAPLFELRGVTFFSLQKIGPAAPQSLRLTDVMEQMADFADTAALVANLDLVISVDTAVAHLAAALGRPVWLLDRHDPCWRWLVGRRDSPWYPTLRLYRQPHPGDWHAVVAEVARDLHGLAARRGWQGNALPPSMASGIITR